MFTYNSNGALLITTDAPSSASFLGGLAFKSDGTLHVNIIAGAVPAGAATVWGGLAATQTGALYVIDAAPAAGVPVRGGLACTADGAAYVNTGVAAGVHIAPWGKISAGRLSVSSTTGGILRSDNFNRADSNVTINSPSDGGADWIIDSGATWGIASNTGKVVATGGQIALEASAANVTVQVTLTTVGSDSGLIGRYADASNFILLAFTGTTTLRLWKNVAGGFTSLAINSGLTLANGDVFKLVMDSANNLTGYQNGVSVVTANDAAGATNTKHGLRSNADTTVRFDDFSIV